MGRLDVSMLQFLTEEDIRILIAIERGMINHEIVPGPLIIQLANLRKGGASKKLRSTICEYKLAAYERGKHYDGYRLTVKGYDYLALNALSLKGAVEGVGPKIGVGKESDIFRVVGEGDRLLCMKLHRLGRTSFRRLKEKRDYHKGRQMSWLYLSRLSATKEFAYMKALHNRGFPVPEPIGVNRHCVIMELIDGYPLCNVSEVEDPAELYNDLMQLIVRLANNGVIHSDFNEFNIMVNSYGKPTLIDFPQMVSTKHENAKMYFERDVQCIVTYFRRKYNYESECYPDFDRDVTPEYELDKEIEASGFNRQAEEFDRFLDKNRGEANDNEDHEDGSEEDGEDNDEDGEDNDEEDGEDNDEEDGEDNDEEDGEDNDDEEDSEDEPYEGSEEEAENSSSPKVQILKPVECDDNSGDLMRKATMDMFFMSMKENAPKGHSRAALATLVEGRELATPSGAPQELPSPPRGKDDDTVSVSSRRSKYSNTGQTMDEETRKDLRQNILQARKTMREARERGERVNLMEVLEGSKHESDRLSCYSFSTTASTVDPATLKLRANREVAKKDKKQVSKKKLRVKGEANAYNRKKRENDHTIKDTMACADVWG